MFRHDVIPIIMGARPEDYAASLPPHSYIHIDDFKSPRELADYLHVLDKNDTLYNGYFRWKTGYMLPNFLSYWCLVCGLLHIAHEQNYVHWYPEYSKYWDGERNSICNAKWVERDGARWMTWKP
jgi:glycoprotein 3-alpha-L-fucosyltransferase